MIIKLPEVDPEIKKQYLEIFDEFIAYNDRKIEALNKRSNWKKFWDPKTFERMSYLIVNITVQTLRKIFTEDTKFVEIDEN